MARAAGLEPTLPGWKPGDQPMTQARVEKNRVRVMLLFGALGRTRTRIGRSRNPLTIQLVHERVN